jgi:hypothetical protein
MFPIIPGCHQKEIKCLKEYPRWQLCNLFGCWRSDLVAAPKLGIHRIDLIIRGIEVLYFIKTTHHMDDLWKLTSYAMIISAAGSKRARIMRIVKCLLVFSQKRLTIIKFLSHLLVPDPFVSNQIDTGRSTESAKKKSGQSEKVLQSEFNRISLTYFLLCPDQLFLLVHGDAQKFKHYRSASTGCWKIILNLLNLFEK